MYISAVECDHDTVGVVRFIGKQITVNKTDSQTRVSSHELDISTMECFYGE